jgi:hypothetical protein
MSSSINEVTISLLDARWQLCLYICIPYEPSWLVYDWYLCFVWLQK